MPFQFTKSCSNPDISGRICEWCVFIRYSQIRNVSVLAQPSNKLYKLKHLQYTKDYLHHHQLKPHPMNIDNLHRSIV